MRVVYTCDCGTRTSVPPAPSWYDVPDEFSLSMIALASLGARFVYSGA